MSKELRWRVRYGFGATDFITIGESELEKVKYVWATRGVYQMKISGALIQSIKPDYHFYLGWNEDYEPTGDDWGDIRANVPLKEIALRESLAEARVALIAERGDSNLLGNLKEVDRRLISMGRVPLLLSEEAKKL